MKLWVSFLASDSMLYVIAHPSCHTGGSAKNSWS